VIQQCSGRSSLAFAASLTPEPSPAGPQGTPPRTTFDAVASSSGALNGLASPSKHHPPDRKPQDHVNGRATSRLSWDCPRYAPPPTFPVLVHSRRRPRPLPSVSACHSGDHVPPLRFPTASMACSKHRLQVCCNPSQTGFAAFCRAHADSQPSELGRRPETAPRPATQFVPFKGFPSSTAGDTSPRAFAFMPLTAPVSLSDT